MYRTQVHVELNGFKGTVTINEPVLRYPGNPVLTCHDVNKVWGTDSRLYTYTVHNAGMAKVTGANGKNQTIMLFRSHIADGRSVIGKAVSDNGLNSWRVDPRPFLLPATENDVYAEGVNVNSVIEYEAGGVEDIRVNPVGSDLYVLTYSAYHQQIPDRVKVMMAVTNDFRTVIRYGPISEQDMRNVVIFPEPDKNKTWRALLRPNDKGREVSGSGHIGGSFGEICAGFAPSPTGPWEIGNVIMRSGHGPSAFQAKIGPGAPPIRTRYGWLNIFHGVRSTMAGNPYTLGVAFHDLEDPTDTSKIRISAKPILMHSRSDCLVKETDYVHVPNVVFSCGALTGRDDTVAIYYGGNDTVMNVGLANIQILSEMCNVFRLNPLTGKHLYSL
ncbi:putative glycoside hydrolase [hydrocarbon metagenome]|uniref:Putative glycoside hydrolase n=1 Tax=hydrocarbon metagenome TaxID=938273 RepID=A0A0W8E9U3_9ZZZZ